MIEYTESIIETTSIFLITIINKNLIISFILGRPKDFAVQVEYYKLDYLRE